MSPSYPNSSLHFHLSFLPGVSLRTGVGSFDLESADFVGVEVGVGVPLPDPGMLLGVPLPDPALFSFCELRADWDLVHR
jgi:hypothetical protein